MSKQLDCLPHRLLSCRASSPYLADQAEEEPSVTTAVDGYMLFSFSSETSHAVGSVSNNFSGWRNAFGVPVLFAILPPCKPVLNILSTGVDFLQSEKGTTSYQSLLAAGQLCTPNQDNILQPRADSAWSMNPTHLHQICLSRGTFAAPLREKAKKPTAANMPRASKRSGMPYSGLGRGVENRSGGWEP